MVIDPPSKLNRRARPWAAFENIYEPIPKADGSLLWDGSDIDWPNANPRHFWTVVESDGGLLYVLPGWHCVNRIGYVHCEHAWGGKAADNPVYRY